ncbi:MAG: hypothetical protein WBB65_00430, partial [Anaerolineales bacterium]
MFDIHPHLREDTSSQIWEMFQRNNNVYRPRIPTNEMGGYMKTSSWALLATGLILVLLSLTQILGAAQGLEIIEIPDSDPPTVIIAPSTTQDEAPPVILVGHGFAGSELLMRGFSFPLAKAGYTVVAWDFDGHGRNPRPYLQDMT